MKTLEILEQIRFDLTRKNRNNVEMKKALTMVIDEFIDNTIRLDYNLFKTPEEVAELINRAFGCNILERGRFSENVFGRFAFAHYMKTQYKYSSLRTGKFLNKNHATVLFYYRQHEEMMRQDQGYLKNYNDFKIMVYGKSLEYRDCVNI